MGKQEQTRWPWMELEAEFMTSSTKQYPSVKDFYLSKGIPQRTGEKATVGWVEKRNLILQNAAKKALNQYENRLAKMIVKQGTIASAIIDASFRHLIKTDKKGNPIIPIQFKTGKGGKEIVTPSVVQRLLMQSMGIEQRLTSAAGTGADRVGDQAMYKTGAPGEASQQSVDSIGDSEKLKNIRKDPKLLAQAEKLIEAMDKNKKGGE